MLPQFVPEDERVRVGTGTTVSGNPMIRLHHPGNRVEIGNYCTLAQEVTIFAGGNHPMNFVSQHALNLIFETGDFAGWTRDCGDGDAVTRIGSDVWLGHGCTILSGADIGDGAVIGARAVVRGRVAPYAVVIGNPATVVRHRFDPETIAQLLRIQWWNWPADKIRSEVPSLTSSDLPAFLRRFS